jgi:hypothetical protein
MEVSSEKGEDQKKPFERPSLYRESLRSMLPCGEILLR